MKDISAEYTPLVDVDAFTTEELREFFKNMDIDPLVSISWKALFHPHLLRHTSASIAITNGADVASVSARLGHSDTAITLRMYTHANEESIRRAGDTVRNLLKKES